MSSATESVAGFTRIAAPSAITKKEKFIRSMKGWLRPNDLLSDCVRTASSKDDELPWNAEPK